MAMAEVLDPGLGIVKARLWYTLDEDAVSKEPSISNKATWLQASAVVCDGWVTAEIPVGTKVCYLSVYESVQPDVDRNYMCGSSAFLFVK